MAVPGDEDFLNLFLEENVHVSNGGALAAATVGAGFLTHQILSKRSAHGGRVPLVPNLNRRESTWVSDYLGDTPIYKDWQFRRRFRVPKILFWALHNQLVKEFPDDFAQKRNCAGRLGLKSQIKILLPLRRLGTGRSFDDLDDGACMAEETARKITETFCRRVVDLFGDRYLNRRPTPSELSEIEERYSAAGFPGCVGAVDCCKVIWKNCPKSLKGQFHNPKDGKMAVITTEAWCDRNRYIWHWFAGRPGTNNDRTLVDQSPLFNDILNNSFAFRLPSSYYLRSESPREIPYFLVDGIYPYWAIFAKPIACPSGDAEKFYTKAQEAVRKDIECCFGILQARFNVLRQENKKWYLKDVVCEGQACVIIHNMLVDMKKQGKLEGETDENGAPINVVEELHDLESMLTEKICTSEESDQRVSAIASDEIENFEDYMLQYDMYTSPTAHKNLRNELVKSLWERRGACA